MSESIPDLQVKVQTLQQEISVLEGKIANRDPKILGKLRQENTALEKRFNLLKKALFAIIAESYQPRTAEESKLQYESLRQAAVDYCKKAKIDPELWKSIAS